MIKYKLLKDLPTQKRGTIYKIAKEHSSVYYPDHSSGAWFYGIPEEIVCGCPEWFEPIPEPLSSCIEGFKWDDEMAQKFVTSYLHRRNNSNIGIREFMPEFKKSHQSTDTKKDRERDWEIVSFIKGDGILTLSNGKYRNDTNSIGLEACLNQFKFPIHSVLRKSDNITFQIGDEVKWAHHDPFKIISFRIGLSDEMFAVDNDDTSFDINKNLKKNSSTDRGEEKKPVFNAEKINAQIKTINDIQDAAYNTAICHVIEFISKDIPRLEEETDKGNEDADRQLYYVKELIEEIEALKTKTP